MKKQNWLYGIMIAVVMLMCGTSFASPLAENGIYSEPIYDTVAFTADTDDPGLVNWRYYSWAMYAYIDMVPSYLETVTTCDWQSKHTTLPDKVPVAI